MTDQILTLHVDDEEQFNEIVATYLERIDDDITVLTEADPTAALERLRAEPVDCVISDFQMPRMDGLEFLRAVREDYPNLPFILFTGKGSEDVASEAINAGVTSYLQKGSSERYEQLANRVRNSVRRHRSERRAKIARDKLVRLYEQTDGFYSVADDWTITYWNQQMADRTGRSPESVIGETLWDVFPEAVGTDLAERCRAAMEEREPREFESYYEPHDYWIETRVYPVEDGLFVHSRDITEKKEHENQIERRNQILESFANTVSHDLRNPLSVAEGRLQLAQETGDFEHLDEVAQAHNRMRNLIDELLRIARGDDLSLSDVAVRECAEEAWRTVSAEEMRLVVEDDARVRAHESQLRRLFENLFWNTVEHGDADTVTVGRLADGIYVEDDGTGISASDHGVVFESGYSTKDDSPGYGLHIVEGIANLHDWSITATDAASGGARFELREVRLAD